MTVILRIVDQKRLTFTHRVPTPLPFSTQGKADRNHLNEGITPLLPAGIGEQYSQTKPYQI
jgi:hypothetical protein